MCELRVAPANNILQLKSLKSPCFQDFFLNLPSSMLQRKIQLLNSESNDIDKER